MKAGGLDLHLVTFGGGRYSIRQAARRIGREARSSGWFTTVTCFTDRSLARSYPGFFDLIPGDMLTSRGFGYWVWKPFVTQKALERLPASSVLLYIDAGSHLHVNTESGKRLREYVEIAKESGGLLMQLKVCVEIEWTKAKVLDALHVSQEDRRSDQIAASAFFLVRTPENLALCRSWLQLAQSEGFALIDDSLGPSEDPRLREHRHDQSIFSCLSKRTTLARVPDETDWYPDWWTRGDPYPLWALRHRSGTNPAKHGLATRCRRRVEEIGDRRGL